MKKLFTLLFLIILITAFSGCIDIELAKKLFYHKEEKKVSYKDVTKAKISHVFKYLYPIENLYYTNQTSILIKNDTKWLRVDFSIRMEKIPENLSQYFPNIPERYVNITFKFPNGTIWWQEKYNYTITDSKKISEPIAGNWSISVEAIGIGIGFVQVYNDELSIEVVAREKK